MKRIGFDKRRIFMLASIAVLVAASACATTRGPKEQISDAAITTKVESKLAADPETNPFEIGVDTVNGVVHLSGVVEEEKDRQEAEELARNTEGVQRIVNEIQIGDLSTRQVADDAMITTRVKSRLAAEEGVSVLNIDVDTTDGVVTLFGLVESSDDREEAEKVARATPGVKNVRNRLQVKRE